MTVILLDPLRPTLVPLEAFEFLGAPVQFTEDVPVALRWRLAHVGHGQSADVLVSTDARNDEVLDRITKGDTVIAAPTRTGDTLIEAVDLMDRLWRAQGWEVTQTHESLREYLLEETYELLDAIEAKDPDLVKEELGDLLLQVLFHSRIAQASERAWNVDDVAAALVAKLAHRSPHLAEALSGPVDVDEQVRTWEQRKATEKARRSSLDGIATTLPALAFAEKVIGRATRAGLPADLIPDTLRTVEVGDGAETRLRAAVLDLATKVRTAEDTAADVRGRREPLTDADWRKFWP